MIRLITSLYPDSNCQRNAEIAIALTKNITNPFIDQVVILNEGGEYLNKNPKIKDIPHGRPTFKDFFNVINEMTSDEDINILVNSDIYLDATVNSLNSYDLENKVLCLLRWELNMGDPIIEIFRGDCQDTWVWKGKMRELDYSNFNLGKLGCDNRIAWELQNKGYELENPCGLVRTIHVHGSQKRNYKQTVVGQTGHNENSDVIPSPYAYVNPI